MTAMLSLREWRGWRVVIAATAIQTLAYMSLWLQPSVVAELSGRGMSAGQAGVIATVETLIIAVMLLLAVRWHRAVIYLPTALAGLALSAGATIGCLMFHDFFAVLVLRAVAALGFGLLMLVSNMAIAQFERPDVMFGRIYSVTLLCSAALLLLLPWVGAIFHRPPAFPTYLLVATAMIPLVLLMPPRNASPPRAPLATDSGRPGLGARAIIWLAAGAAGVGLGFGLVWAFLVVLGQAAGLSAGAAGEASGLSLAGALIGSVAASSTWRVLRSRMIFRASLLIAGIGLLLMIGGPSPMLFIVGCVISMAGMYFFFPTVLGKSVSFDDSGRGIALINGALSFLSALGPMIAGQLIGFGGRAALGAVTFVAIAVAVLLFELVWRRFPGPDEDAAPIPAVA